MSGSGTSGWVIGVRLLIAVLGVVGALLTLANTVLKQETDRPPSVVHVDDGGPGEWVDSPFGNGQCDGGYDPDPECFP